MDISAKFRIVFKDEDVFKLEISAWNGFFGGSVEIYEGIGKLEKAASTIEGFPNSPADARQLNLGTFDPAFAGGGVQMKFHCVGGVGRAFVELKMKSGTELAGTFQQALLSLPIEGHGVDAFVQGLRGLEAHDSGVATLKGVQPL